MRKRSLWVTLIVVVLGVLVALPFALSPWAASRLRAQVRESCPECEFDFHSGWVTPLGIFLHGVTFNYGSAKILRVEAQASQVSAHFEWLALFRHELIFSRIAIGSPRVTLIDSEGQSAESESEPPVWTFGVRHLRVHNGEFTYVRNTHGTSAKLNLHGIESTATTFGTTADLRAMPTVSHTKFRIENSGSVDLHVTTRVFEKPLPIDLDLKAENQDLGDLTPFFKENAGVILKGILLHGHGVVETRGSHLKSTVWAEYRDFDVKLVPMYDRSEVSAFFTNLGMKIAMEKKNASKPREDQVRAVETEREPKESIVSFVLTGLKKAALNVAMPELTK